MLRIGDSHIDPTVQFIAHFGYVEIAWCRENTPMAEQHASRVAEIADRQGSPYLRVFALAAEGMADAVAKRYPDAVNALEKGLEFLRKSTAATEYETEMMANLAECHYRSGAFERARIIAKETIDIARKRDSRLPECRSAIICAAATAIQNGDVPANEVEALFRRAEDLIRISGARIYDALLEEVRTRVPNLN